MLVLVGSIGQRLLALKYVPVYVERNDKDTLASFSRRAYKIVLLGAQPLEYFFYLYLGLNQNSAHSTSY